MTPAAVPRAKKEVRLFLSVAETAPQYQGTHTNCQIPPVVCTRGQLEISGGWQCAHEILRRSWLLSGDIQRRRLSFQGRECSREVSGDDPKGNFRRE
jgi:hypothetical protein